MKKLNPFFKTGIPSDINELRKDISEFYKRGYLREIYLTDEFMLANCCNACYFYFPFVKTSDNKQVVITVNGKLARLITEEPNALALVEASYPGYYKQNGKSVSNANVNNFISIYERFKNNPDESIDFEFEKEMANANKGMKL